MKKKVKQPATSKKKETKNKIEFLSNNDSDDFDPFIDSNSVVLLDLNDELNSLDAEKEQTQQPKKPNTNNNKKQNRINIIIIE